MASPLRIRDLVCSRTTLDSTVNVTSAAVMMMINKKWFSGFKASVIMDNLSFYHGQISIGETERRLRQSNIVGSFLLRSGLRNVIVSYLDEQLKTKHKFLPRSRTNKLIKSHQELMRSPQEIFTFLQSLDTIWIHAVDREEEV